MVIHLKRRSNSPLIGGIFIPSFTMELKLLDLFSGIAGFSYAAEKIVGGYRTTQFVENDSYCQSVIRKNFPNIPIHDDITTFKAERGQFDVFTIGFPCQDLSVAGRKKGIGEGTRSGLFYESIRLLREVRPRFALFENVRNLLSHENGETFQEVLFQIAKAGYDAEWSVISARDLGACHLRERIWIVAYPQSQSSNVGKSESFFNKESHKSESRNSSIKFTNSNNYGLSSSEGLRVDGKTDSGTQERQNQTGKSAGSSESRNSEVVQRATELTDTNGKRLERRLPEQQQELQENGQPGQKDSLCSTDTDSERTQSDRTEQATSIWTNAFLNSKERRTLSPNWRGYVSEPCLCRGDDGLRGRVARLKALGNSIVPACAAVPLQRIKDLNSIIYND